MVDKVQPSSLDPWEEIFSLNESFIASHLHPVKQVPNEEELKQLFSIGDWSIDTPDDLLEITNRGIQQILRELSSEQVLNVLPSFPKAVQEHFLDNYSGRAREYMLNDLKKANPTKGEVKQAQEEIISIATQQLTIIEQDCWDKLMLELPEQSLPDKADLDLLLALDEKATNLWLDNILSEQLIHAMLLDDEWLDVLWEPKIEPIIHHRFEDLMDECYQPQFPWQCKIAQRLITYYAQLVE